MSVRPGRAPRSVFWTVAGVFLVAALFGTLAQVFVAVAVLRPLEERDLHARAEIAVGRMTSEIAADPALPDSARWHAVIERIRVESELRLPVVFRSTDGWIASDRPERGRALVDLLDGREPPPRDPADPRGRETPPRPRVLVSHVVEHAGSRLGTLLVLYLPRPNRGPWPLSPNALLLSLPTALLASLVAALVMVRLLVRRLRTLEEFAQKVAAHDLTARIADDRGDEIGRLSGRFNEMAERLDEARARLQREEAQRRQLFADITHELATPLTSIRGYTETLLAPNVPVSDDERGRYLGNMLEETRRLDRLIRDLFDLARLEAGASPLERERLDWAALCRNVAQRFEPRFARAGLTLAWREGARDAWVSADGHRLEQVIENLLQNALRYVPAGGTVTLSLAPAALEEGAAGFRLTVEDDGPGAPPEEIERLFERFYRAAARPRNEAAEAREGSGLGLAIVREIVRRHGGEARASARTPRGLAIAVELPAGL